jgi:hypothetical protein
VFPEPGDPVPDHFCGPENAFLRQQVIVLKRQRVERPAIPQQGRHMLVMLASKMGRWKGALRGLGI